ncbi:MAG TPA: hypothetical protein VKE93_10920 [Candidatus Angelobacter sp.]|nr:hypothetical protein [Candidatus Angelobacter sp.]
MKTFVKLASILVLILAVSNNFLVAQKKAANTASDKASAKAEDSKAAAEKPLDKDKSDKPKDPLENLRFRNLGPAVGGGRVSAVAGIPGKPGVYYVGAAAGGVWLTQDSGFTWKPIFEKESTASIGAIALAPSNPNLIWVGTGEKNPRNDVVTGKGVYFSSDAGATWKFMGLRDAGQISNIAIDPDDPNIVFVGVLGHVWAPNADRGVFRTTDGGKTWQKVLFVDDQTGASSLVMDPGNPMVLFAGMWRMRRYPWMLDSGGTSGGIFRSVDGGTTWTKLTDGLPEGLTGRIGLGAAPSNGRHIYALVENKRGVLYDTTDLGDHWHMVSNNHQLAARGFYFSELVVSPKDENKIYFLSYNIMLSEDGGKTARPTSARVHVDHHTMWIDPMDPSRIINGNDGGAYISADAGHTWRYLDNLPIEQFYSVAADDETPYMLCGGLQDNNAWCGPSSTLSRGPISGADWFTVTGGDGEYAVPAGHGSHTVYVDSQNGSISRLNIENGMSSSIRPYLYGVQSMKPADLKYRFNWTSPIAVSPTDPNEVYLGGSVLFRSTDGGTHFTPISPDLTRNDKEKQLSSGGPIWLDLSGAETVGAILSMSLSPVDPKTIWVGTDDGVVQVTRDGGKNWTNVTAAMTGLPQWGRIQQIEASPSDANSAYVAVDFHEVDNNKPYVFKTHDGGKTWTSIAQGLPGDDPARAIREDPNHKGFLVLGTDTSLFYSTDDGAHWTPLKSNFPTVPVFDIKFIKKTHDLVVATHGRGLFVMDDITPLEESASADLAKSEFHVYPVPPAVNWHFWNRRGGFTQTGFVTPNPLTGAIITYTLPTEIKPNAERGERAGDAERQGGGTGAGAGRGAGGGFGGGRGGRGQTPVKITISDSSGQVIRTMYGPAKYGVNRVAWNLRYEGPKRLTFLQPQERDEESEFFFDPSSGPTALPGTYKIAVTVNGKTETQSVEVQTDPRFKLDPAALEAQFKMAMELRGEVSALNEALNRLANLHKQIASLQEMLGSDENGEGVVNASYRPVLEEARALDRKLQAMQTPLYNNETQPGSQDDIHYLQRFHDKLQGLMRSVMGGFGEPPKDIQIEAAADARKEVETVLQQFNSFVNTEVAAFNKKAAEHGSSTLFAGGPVEIKSTAAGAGAGTGDEDDEQPDQP